ncbi:uncharacterized protein LOC121381402 isoform X2 [Gigantopelta aegis]|uniref:uncharacterized protein LOC121381402 isoform X2 n=1 Tax=Gigantopelta aegis TaxID=1735272 RepID=UPI001B88DDDC|nr:uncharacterized protein LOC121381402 isoform X2 [Gigantopelta aegis]
MSQEAMNMEWTLAAVLLVVFVHTIMPVTAGGSWGSWSLIVSGICDIYCKRRVVSVRICNDPNSLPAEKKCYGSDTKDVTYDCTRDKCVARAKVEEVKGDWPETYRLLPCFASSSTLKAMLIGPYYTY